MSKRNRNKHLNTIELLSNANEKVPQLINADRLQDVLLLLADCQDGAIALGNHIERLYGVGTDTVGRLETYCEALYQLSVCLNEGVQIEEAIFQLKDVTQTILDTYLAEFPEKKEVIFLPYNASMWDSLESVWMAARDDENCDAYVVPIPYYDLDSERRFKTFHYEGDLYPDYVPITSYEEYDIELRLPDTIYIHNPYDECNLVTSIMPEFYSSRIKAFTDKLVYIPYFVLGEINPENQIAIDKIKHFCYLPGVHHADTVIVQSENMRQIYINEYIKAAEVDGIKVDRESLEKKILGLGSPKFDKVSNTKKDNLQVPMDWLRIIEKEDGSWKKIIFYNTTIAAFLNNREKMLEKIEDVLRIFKENKENVALLWRPHPLLLQTIESMSPELRDAYIEIVKGYQDEGWGIYDDTSDMDRAVVISDAYYGDMSSVVQVYQETGKPIMVQNVEIIN